MKLWKAAVAILILYSLCSVPILATQSEIDGVQDDIEKLEEQKKEAQDQAESLNDSKDNLEGDLAELNDSLTRIAAALNETEEKLAGTEKNLEQIRTALLLAQEEETRQYEAMKKRIQFLYETDQSGILGFIMEADSFADFLNKSEYIADIHAYDREKLEEYRMVREEIAKNQEEQKAEEENLKNLSAQQERQKQELAKAVDGASQELTKAREQLVAAQADITDFEAKIAEQKEYEEKLEAQKAREDAARLEEIRRQEEELRRQREEEEKRKQEQAQAGQNKPAGENGGSLDTGGESGSQGVVEADASDVALMAALIQCEADGESYEGKLAVGSVVVNRVRSSYFPNTIAGVIYQSGQFSPVASGRFATVLAAGANKTCVQAAQEVLGGKVTLNCLFFRTNNGLIDGIVIGNHVFY